MVTLVNRAKVSTSTTGTGTVTLGAAESGYQTFADAGVADGDVVRYVIEDGTSWEIGTGTYTASGTTLSRTVSESSNADAAINLSGEAVVYVTAAAADIVQPSDVPAAVDAHLNTSTASSGEVLSWTGSDYDWIAAGGGGTALELYAENPSSPTAPSATGTNAVAIGSESVSAGLRSISLGDARAGGDDSFAAAIANNTSSYGSTATSSVAIGYLAKTTGTNCVAAGKNSLSYGNSAIALGDYSKANGSKSTAIGERAETDVNASNSTAIGYRPKAFVKGQIAFSSAYSDASAGNQQGSLYVLKNTVSNATPVPLLTEDGASANTTNQIILQNNSAFAFHGTIVARQQASAGTACAAWKIEGLIRREGSAGTTVLVNSATTVLDNTPSWGMALSADTTNGGLAVTVTGAAATNIRWVATIHTSEVTY